MTLGSEAGGVSRSQRSPDNDPSEPQYVFTLRFPMSYHFLNEDTLEPMADDEQQQVVIDYCAEVIREHGFRTFLTPLSSPVHNQ